MPSAKITFREPPLVEVSLGVQFRRLPNLKSAHLGLFWSTLGGDFPEASDQVPIGLQEGLEGVAWPVPRVWLVHKDKALLIQLQGDRFYLNWRRLQKELEYPRFTNIAPLFERYWQQWVTFIAEQGVGSIEPTACELSYVNHFEIIGGQRVQDVATVLRPMASVGSAGDLPDVYGVAWNAVYKLGWCNLIADLKTLTKKESDEKRLQFELKCQSTADIGGSSAVSPWMEAAHDSIVNAFLNLTAERAQRDIWNRVS